MFGRGTRFSSEIKHLLEACPDYCKMFGDGCSGTPAPHQIVGGNALRVCSRH